MTAPSVLAPAFCWVLSCDESQGNERRFLQKIWEYELDREVVSRGGKPRGLICRSSSHLDEDFADSIRRQVFDVEVADAHEVETFVAFPYWGEKRDAWVHIYTPAKPSEADASFVITFRRDASITRQREELVRWFNSISKPWNNQLGARPESVGRKLFNLALYRLMSAPNAQWHSARDVLAERDPERARLLKSRGIVERRCREIEAVIDSALKGQRDE